MAREDSRVRRMSVQLADEEERRLSTAGPRRIVERVIQAAKPEADPPVEPDRRHVDVLGFYPEAASSYAASECGHLLDQFPPGAAPAMGRSNVEMAHDHAPVPRRVLRRREAHHRACLLRDHSMAQPPEFLLVRGGAVVFPQRRVDPLLDEREAPL